MTETDMPIAGEVPFDDFTRYISGPFGTIEGWPGNRTSVEFNKCFHALFSRYGENGGVCEIGVHHGKFLIALHNIFGDRRSLGIDLFHRQAANVDGSGRGDLEICQQNIQRYAKNPDLITLMTRDSIVLSREDIDSIIDEFGRFSLFSIDGGHSKLHVSIDLDNASLLTSPSGIIMVDDLFHPDWPEVTEGLYNSIHSARTPYVPFMITRKKLYLCCASVQSAYAEYCLSNKGPHTAKVVNFAGWRVPSINFGGEY